MEKLLEIKDLSIEFRTRRQVIRAVNHIDLTIGKARSLGLVGETGAGKTTTALGILRLIQLPQGRIPNGEIIFKGKDILKMNNDEIRKIRGKEISMIFQDPMTALNPILTVGEQIAEVIALHENCSAADAAKKSEEMLEMVGIRRERAVEYPHQFSGGMKQRVVIAMALACSPSLLIADEPTTALDVTIQAQVLEMMSELREQYGTSMLLITHDLGIVAENCDDVAIMYAGEIIEYGSLERIFHNPRHPYTIGLFGSIPSLDKDEDRLHPIDGLMPDPADLPSGCKFQERCHHVCDECRSCEQELCELEPEHKVRCHRVLKGEI